MPPALSVCHANVQVFDMATPPGLKLLQFNANGLLGKLDQLLAFMRSHNIAVAAIQAMKWSDSIELPLLGADPMEVLAISLDISPAPLTIVNVYIPPTFSCPPGFTASIAPCLPSEDSLVLALDDELEQVPFAVLNGNSQTRLSTNGASSSFDVSLASLSLVASTMWSTEISLVSDHLPILLELATADDRIKAPSRHFINFKRADWTAFTAEYEAEIDGLPPPTRRSEPFVDFFWQQQVTTSRTAAFFYFVLTIRLKRERHDIRARDANDPHIVGLNGLITKTINDGKRRCCHELIADCSFRGNSAVTWKMSMQPDQAPG
ncbi:unnamed protein product [Dibothriocephalus latus]|uniref:Endonuclease/exonuclease/phosphatase domain-containing protein n=1 Tax=Dibothriocephalus latus TaxID=60516 RepID=A0A3P6RUL4_DIBLA|nr:unnamed protein product [Dibothriocephalus latus]